MPEIERIARPLRTQTAARRETIHAARSRYSGSEVSPLASESAMPNKRIKLTRREAESSSKARRAG